MSKLWLYTGDRPSNGAKELADEPGFLRLRAGRFHKVKAGDIIVNWGVSSSAGFQALQNRILNFFPAVGIATNKLEAFKALGMAGVEIVQWTKDREVAQHWSNNEHVVVVRNKLTGHSGDGIIIIEKLHQVPEAPLYTKYVWKDREFRVHVCNGVVIDTQQKIKDPDREVVTWKVRSHANGFIFARNNVAPSAARDSLAIAAIKALGLDFGAVDIVQDKHGALFVLEVNTAPGLEGQTVTSYAEAFRGYQSEA